MGLIAEWQDVSSEVSKENIPLLGSLVNHVLTYPSYEQGQHVSYVAPLLVPALTAIKTHLHTICHRNGVYSFRVIAFKNERLYLYLLKPYKQDEITYHFTSGELADSRMLLGHCSPFMSIMYLKW